MSLSAERRFQLLVDGISEYGICLLSKEGYVSSWNAGAARIKGFQQEEIVGRHFSRCYTEEDRNKGEPEHALATAAKSGRFEQDGWRLRKDGSRFWANVVIDPIRDDNGKLIGFAEITRDHTERKRSTDAIQQARTRLLQAQRMETIGQLAGGIAHDFNNVLSVVSNSLDLLGGRLQQSTDIAVVETAMRAAARGGQLASQLLAFARRQELKAEHHDLAQIITAFRPILERSCGDAVRLDTVLPARLRKVLLDSQQFETALLNLMMNAREATKDGGSITLTGENLEFVDREAAGKLAPGSYVRIAVRDTGHGMAPEIMQQAFEPFFTTRDNLQHSGLGLSQVYGFVTQSGGEVVIESKPACGTTVSMYFPCSSSVEDTGGGNGETDGTPGIARTSEKVLIVDDDADVLDIAVQIFRSLGYDVVTAANGLEALDVLKNERDIGILFTDVVMPMGMSGIELARFSRKLCPGIHVMLASGYPARVLAAEYGDLDEFIFISKPFRWTELLEKIRLVRQDTSA